MNKINLSIRPLLVDKKLEILLVEGSERDAKLIIKAFRNSKLETNISRVQDGVQAMQFLHRRGRYASRPTPDLIFLDLALQRKDGRKVLKEIHDDPRLNTIRVVVMTSSAVQEDLQCAQELDAESFLRKPGDLRQFLDTLPDVTASWLLFANLPHVPTNSDPPPANKSRVRSSRRGGKRHRAT
jgi:CheY-like chemotaxis protein